MEAMRGALFGRPEFIDERGGLDRASVGQRDFDFQFDCAFAELVEGADFFPKRKPFAGVGEIKRQLNVIQHRVNSLNK
jgi:hypothetical protein